MFNGKWRVNGGNGELIGKMVVSWAVIMIFKKDPPNAIDN